MVPDAFHELFLAAAGAVGALVGMLFVAISVAAGPVVGPTASVRQQVRAAGTLVALLPPLVLALLALIPYTAVGWGSAAYGWVGLLFAAALIASPVFGIDRAWELVGARDSGVGMSLRDLLGVGRPARTARDELRP